VPVQENIDMTPRSRLLAAAGLCLALFARAAAAAELKIAIMQAQAGEARKYQPLLEHLAAKGLPATFVTAPDYPAAAQMFASGKVDAMFSGSGIAGTMIIKGLADPLARPVGKDGVSTYAAVVVAPKGSPRFDGSPRYFDGKRVILTALASAGEFYLRSLGPSKPAAILKAASHGAAVDALARGQADVAVVKNHVWAKARATYPALEAVGGDAGENPDGTLIVSKKVDPDTAQRLAAALLALEGDASPGATAARDALGVRGFVRTGPPEFAHTIALLKRAGITPEFAFAF
jgi:ABC-type phosphate/phosphonate transport system substrate-binding protein